MGLIERILNLIFGGSGVIRETAGVFMEHAEARGERAADIQRAALGQFGSEFAQVDRGVFDRIMDGVNRLPRPAMAIGTLGLFVAAMVDPVWFAQRMQGIALVPQPLWWLLGVIVSFYFGARHQAKGHAFQRSLALTLAATPELARRVAAAGGTTSSRPDTETNPALDVLRGRNRGNL